ncbi:MAG: paraquat-inducible protein A [Steroidobacteraceae bacterium]
MPSLRPGQLAECRRCARLLAGPATGRVDAPLALAVGALLLLVPATVAPLLRVVSYGAVRTSWLASGIGGLWVQGFPSLAAVTAAFSVAFPYLYLVLLIGVLWSLRLGGGVYLGGVFRWLVRLRPWMMLEIFLVACYVAYSRLRMVATVQVLVGGWCLLAASLTLLLALTQLDERTVWETLPVREYKAPARGGRAIACTVCELVVSDAKPGMACLRCGAALHARKPYSFSATAALVAAGFLLYVPANVLPVLTLVSLGRRQSSTIMSGVFQLIHNRLWPLALIVFLASILVPLMKLCGLTWLLLATLQRSPRLLIARTRFFRLIDTVGPWSNIDIFVVSVLVALLRFGTLAQARAGEGLIAFAAVVILTMLATRAFDTRLMWDAPQEG